MTPAPSRLTIEKVVGLPRAGVGCGVFTKRVTLKSFEDEDATIVFTILLTVRTETSEKLPQGDLTQVSHDVFELVCKKLEEEEGASVLSLLKTSSQSAQDYITSFDLDFSFSHALYIHNACYLGGVGEHVKVLVGEGEETHEIPFAFGSGFLKSGQLYLVATDTFLKHFDLSLFRGGGSLQDVIDGLATEISSMEDQSEIGAALVKVEGEVAALDQENAEHSIPVESMLVSGVVEELRPVEQPFKNPLPLIFGKISAVIGGLRRGDRSTVTSTRRNIFVIAILMFLVLGISGGYSIYSRQVKQKQAQVQEHLVLAQSKYNEGVAIIKLNGIRSRELLIEADREVQQALLLDSKNEEVKTLAASVQSSLKETLVSETITFSPFAQGDQPFSSLAFSNKKLLAVRGENLISFTLPSKSENEVKLGAVAFGGVVYDNSIYLVAGGEILKADIVKGGAKSIVKSDGILDIGVFLGNVYVLGEGGILKYVPISDGYSGGSDYLESGTTFNKNSRFAIDGSVWVTNGSTISKFTRGKNDNFEISGLGQQLGELSLIYTTVDMDNIYVIDRVNSALLVIDKEGIFRQAYQSAEFSRCSDILVDESESTLYIASGSKILEASLK